MGRLVGRVVLRRPSCEKAIVLTIDERESAFDFDLASSLELSRERLDPRRLECRGEGILVLGCKGVEIQMRRRVWELVLVLLLMLMLEEEWGLDRRIDFDELALVVRWRSRSKSRSTRIGKELKLDGEVESELVEWIETRRMRKRDRSPRSEQVSEGGRC